MSLLIYKTSASGLSVWLFMLGTAWYLMLICDRKHFHFCVIGAATTFIPSFDFTVLCFQLGTVLFGVYFPFRAREFESKGHCKWIHLVSVINAVSLSALLVGVQFGLGGYSRTMVPVFCLADMGSALVVSVIPTCVILAIFLTLVMLLLFKIFDIAGWKLRTKVELHILELSHIPDSMLHVISSIELLYALCVYIV